MILLYSLFAEATITWPIIASALSTVTLLLIGALATVLWQKANKAEARLDKLEAEQANIKSNYLARFDDLKDHITEKHLKLLDKISILTSMITLNNKKG